MVKIVDKILYSEKPYTFKVEPYMLKKSLACHLFEQRQKQSFPGSEDKILLINARSPKQDVRRGKDFEIQSRKLASALKGIGVKKNDTVLLMMPNNVDYVCPVFATWFLGGCASLVNPALSCANFVKHLSIINTKYVFCSPANVDVVIKGIDIFNFNKSKENIKRINVIVMESIDLDSTDWHCFKDENNKWNVHSYSEIMKTAKPLQDDESPCQFSESDNSVIFWSSGTTGEPKGIIRDFSCFVRSFLDDCNTFNQSNKQGQKIVLTTNMFHLFGLFFTIMHTVKNGRTTVIFTPKALDSNLTMDELFLACHTYRLELLLVSSHHAIRLGHAIPPQKDLDLTSVRWVYPVGAPVHNNLPTELKLNFPSFEYLTAGYGMTETMRVSAWNDPSALGELDPGVIARIVDNEKSTEDNIVFLGPNEVGELQVRTPFMQKGYLEEIHNTKFWTLDRFAKTGDLAYYREDGILCFVGRCKDLIKCQNFHIYPKELEMIIQKQPGVAEVVVFGLPDPYFQEVLSALVIMKEGYTLTEDEVKDCIIKSEVENCKYIRGGVKFVQQIPKNANGKVERSKLPEFFLKN